MLPGQSSESSRRARNFPPGHPEEIRDRTVLSKGSGSTGRYGLTTLARAHWPLALTRMSPGTAVPGPVSCPRTDWSTPCTPSYRDWHTTFSRLPNPPRVVQTLPSRASGPATLLRWRGRLESWYQRELEVYRAGAWPLAVLCGRVSRFAWDYRSTEPPRVSSTSASLRGGAPVTCLLAC
jgi:hypothetical protein